MAINFPSSPSVNDTFTVGSITYQCVQNNPTKWIGLGVTPADRLIEGSNSLEITANNELQWTGGNVGIGTDPTRPLHLHNTSTSALLVSGTAPQIRFNSDAADGVDNERGIVGLATGAGQFMSNSASGDLVIRSENGNSILFGNGTNEKVRIGAGGAGQIGVGTTPTTNAALDINQGYYSIMYGAVNGANGGRPDNSNKEGRIVQYHRDNEQEPLGVITSFSQSTAGSVYIGGGSSLVNAATEVALYAAANTTTTGGTKILSATIDGVSIENDLTVAQAATGVSGTGTSTVSNVVTVGKRNRVNLYQTTNPNTTPTWYLHIARDGSNRASGTVEILQHGELGGQQSGNGANYYKALWSSFNYITDGSLSSVITDNVDAGGNTSRGITGVTVSQTDEEIIYTINSQWYGAIDVIIEWMGGNIQYQLDQTSTTVF